MTIKQIPVEEIQRLKEKATNLRARAQALYAEANNTKALEVIAEATRILTWCDLQEGKLDHLKRCLEQQEEPIKQEPKPKQVSLTRVYKLKSNHRPGHQQTEAYERIFSHGHKPKGKAMPNKIKI